MAVESDKGKTGSQEEQGMDQKVEEAGTTGRLNIAAEEEFPPEVSAKSIPKPSTLLSVVPKGDVGDHRVTLVDELETAPLVEEVRRINQEQTSESRTPLMTVIEALLADGGGTMSVSELASQVKELWNRPFPTSPYSEQEFLFVVASNSDRLRVES
jgi:hypothetical protein